jgi:adenylate cyclase
MRGRVAIFRFGPDSNKQAIDYFDRALKLDPGLVMAKTGLSAALSDRVVFGWSADPRGDTERADKLADEALSAEPDSAFAHFVKALVYQPVILTKLRTPPQPLWEAAIGEAQAATDIDRNFAGAYAISGAWRQFLGRAAEGFTGVETAMRLSPRDPIRPIWEFQICHLHSHLAQWDQALEHCRLAVQGIPNVWYPYADVVFANARLDRDADAKAALADLLKLQPKLTVKGYVGTAALFSDNPAFAQQVARMAEGLRKAGLPE